jgi:hypothetical protein
MDNKPMIHMWCKSRELAWSVIPYTLLPMSVFLEHEIEGEHIPIETAILLYPRWKVIRLFLFAPD